MDDAAKTLNSSVERLTQERDAARAEVGEAQHELNSIRNRLNACQVLHPDLDPSVYEELDGMLATIELYFVKYNAKPDTPRVTLTDAIERA